MTTQRGRKPDAAMAIALEASDAVVEVRRQVEDLAARAPVPGPAGVRGDDGIRGERGAAGPAGRDGEDGEGFTWRGRWEPEAEYQPRDVVQHNGSTWIAVELSRDQAPPAPTWELMAARGERGPAGMGSQGPAGPPGPQGIQGPPGEGGGGSGEDGASAYEVAVANGFVGDEAAWLASLVGAPGADGAPGAPGPSNIIEESGGPTTLTVGAIADGEFLKRVGTTVVGATPAGGSPSLAAILCIASLRC